VPQQQQLLLVLLPPVLLLAVLHSWAATLLLLAAAAPQHLNPSHLQSSRQTRLSSSLLPCGLACQLQAPAAVQLLAAVMSPELHCLPD
jgi:hypothetical protein